MLGLVAEGPALSFGGLLRQLRDDAGLTQEELARAASLSPRSVSDLERGINRTARKDTAALLADALGLAAPARVLFVAAARGRAPAAEVLAARDGTAAGASAAAATRTLPRDIASFTGRGTELAQLTGAVTAAAASGGVVGIHAVGGMAGIGKTTFAVHAAHLLAASFPDGQFYLPLHAHTPGQRPVDPADALASLLLTAGVAAQQIPAGVEARAGRWRDSLAGKKVLLVLDDAAGHEQVRPLLPGTGGSLVLVTSRRHLTALEDAAAISLDTLPPGEAAVLLARLAGRPGLRAGDAAAGEIARLCGYLPLAVGMLARQLHHHPAWTAAGLAADLATARDRLELMRAENLSVAAAFDLSYHDLTPGQQRLFRRLGLHPGPDIDPYAAAALDDTSLATARRHLEGLYDQHLITEPARGRYRLHDLLREHARTLAAAGDPAAAGRLLDYYLHTALAADQHIPSSATSPGRRPPPGHPPAQAPRLSTARQAAAWLETERPNLHAAAGYAAASARPRHAIAIPAAISGFLHLHGHLDQAAALHQGALTAAGQARDRPGQAGALYELGIVQLAIGDYPAAGASLARALELFGDLGDRPGQAGALSQLGALQLHTGGHAAAAASQQQALALYRDLGHRPGQAWALNSLGLAQLQTGNYPAAAATYQQALGLFGDLGDRLGQADVLDGLGTVQELTGDYPAAAASLTQALGMFRDLGHRLGQADVLTGLGVVHALTGDYPAAAASQQQALALYRGSGDRIGQASVHREIGIVQRLTGDYPAAAASLSRALGMFRECGHRRGPASVLNELGAVQRLAGDYPAAAASHQQALEVYIDLGDRHSQAEALNNLGDLLSRSPPARRARDHYDRALAIARDIGAPLEEAQALEGTGRCDLRDGRPGEAVAHLRQALTIYQRIGAPGARRVQATLRDHDI
jgi:tetratricopeptide (TPR) repeat protein/transcriptional regulator with XRE-family HTH domain